MWYSFIFFAFVGCHLEPALISQAHDVSLNISSKDKYLVYLITKAFKQQKQAFVHAGSKPYTINVKIQDTENPLMYSATGEVECWHKRLIADVLWLDHKEKLIVHGSYMDKSDFGNVFLAEKTTEKLAQEFVRQLLVLVQTS